MWAHRYCTLAQVCTVHTIRKEVCGSGDGPPASPVPPARCRMRLKPTGGIKVPRRKATSRFRPIPNVDLIGSQGKPRGVYRIAYICTYPWLRDSGILSTRCFVITPNPRYYRGPGYLCWDRPWRRWRNLTYPRGSYVLTCAESIEYSPVQHI